MNRRNAGRLAWGLCGAALCLLGLSLFFVYLGWPARLPRGFASWQGQTVTVVGALGPALLGGLIASRRPDNRYGWLWCVFGLSTSALALGTTYAAYAVATGRELGSPDPLILLGGTAWGFTFTLFPFLFLLFPDGSLPSPRWRFVARGAAGGGIASVVASPFLPGNVGIAPVANPLAATGLLVAVVQSLTYGGVLVLFLATILSALSLVARFRRASCVQRQQIKWFAYAASLVGAHIVFTGVLGRELPGVWHQVLEMATLAGLYLAVGIAILRYRLYDIDRIINHTLVYAALSAVLAGVYALCVVVLPALVGAGSESDLVVAGSTLLVAALFTPARRRIQGFIDRRFYRSRYDAHKTVEAFGERLRNEVRLGEVSGDLLAVVKATLQPARASLWLRGDEGST